MESPNQFRKRRPALMYALVQMICVFLCANLSWNSHAAAQRNSTLERNPALSPSSVSGAPSNTRKQTLRLRFSWGGGRATRWLGSVKFESNVVGQPVVLGLDPNTPGSVLKLDDEIKINQQAPSTYAGFEIDVGGDPDSTIELILYPADQPEQQQVRLIPLKQVLRTAFSSKLDEQQNRFTVERAPGDAIQVRLNRKHLVFDSNDRFEFDIKATHTRLRPGKTKSKFELVRARSDPALATRLWTHSTDLEIDETGSSDWQRVAVELPAREGVYDLRIEMAPPSGASPLRGRRIENVSRTIQMVVLENETPAITRAAEDNAKDNAQDNATSPRITITPREFVQSNRNQQLNQLLHGSTGSRIRPKTVNSVVGEVVEMPAGGWQAIPLRIPKSEADKPHILEIDYPTDSPMMFGVSLLQKDAVGQVPMFGLDSGVHVPPSFVERSEITSVATHRVTFWPSKNPILLIANRHDQRPARFREIRIYQKSAPRTVNEPIPENHRRLMAFYELPIFTDHFGGSKSVDSELNQPIDDWITYHQAIQRLIDHLKENGYGGAMLNVACDGSSLFPLDLLQPTAKFDTGVFCSQGRDPIRKDVVELLFRMFERAGLRLIPTLAFNESLPSVEKRLSLGGPEGTERLIDFRNGSPGNSRSLPIYNPLSLTVQHSVSEIVAAVADRYHHRPGFVGLGVLCRPDTVTLLPGRQWGYDAKTIASFANSLPAATLDTSLPIDQQQAALLGGELHEPWMLWRAGRVSAWYESMATAISQKKTTAKLYLAPIDVFRSSEIAAELSPSLHRTSSIETVMLRLGFNATVLQHPAIRMFKPHRSAPLSGLADSRAEFSVEDSKQLDQWIGPHAFQGDLFVNRATWAHFQQLEKQQPFSKQAFPLMRLHQLTPAAASNRKRFVKAIYRSDSQMLVDGGWVLNLGEETALKDLIETFSQLPDKKFQPVKSTQTKEGVAVRQYFDGKDHYLYMVNATPWPIKIELPVQFQGAGKLPRSLATFSGASMQVATLSDTGLGSAILHTVNPYGLAGCVVPGQRLRMGAFDGKFPVAAEQQLRKSYYELRSDLIRSGEVKPLPVLANTGFEQLSQQNLVGWSIGKQDSSRFQFDSRMPKSGVNALMISNTSEESAWIRSNSFAAPRTGRLSVSVWLRTESVESQPPLRISVESTSTDSSYYRFGSVGSLAEDKDSNQITSKWKRFGVHFDDLPIEDVGNLRIGFDMMGPGKIWIDQCEVYDRWFDENDTQAMTQLLAGAGLILEQQGDLEACRQILAGYWPTFLREHFSEEAVARSKARNVARQSNQPNERTSSIKQRLRRLNPNRVVPR